MRSWLILGSIVSFGSAPLNAHENKRTVKATNLSYAIHLEPRDTTAPGFSHQLTGTDDVYTYQAFEDVTKAKVSVKSRSFPSVCHESDTINFKSEYLDIAKFGELPFTSEKSHFTLSFGRFKENDSDPTYSIMVVGRLGYTDGFINDHHFGFGDQVRFKKGSWTDFEAGETVELEPVKHGIFSHSYAMSMAVGLSTALVEKHAKSLVVNADHAFLLLNGNNFPSVKCKQPAKITLSKSKGVLEISRCKMNYNFSVSHSDGNRPPSPPNAMGETVNQ